MGGNEGSRVESESESESESAHWDVPANVTCRT
jgi:hypothetical protein